MRGLVEVTEAAETTQAAEDVAAVAAIAEAAGVEDLTRALHAEIVAARVE